MPARDPFQLVADLAGAPPLRWEELSWAALESLYDMGHRLVLLPVGATEQHGPHLPTGTDTLIARAACDYASARTQTPVLPALPFGVSVGHTAKWHGTLSMTHETFALSLRELIAWLIARGWTKVLLVNSHFGNDPTLRTVVDRLRTDHLGTLQIATLNTFNLSPAVWQRMTEDAADLHANKAETDLLLYLAPGLVDESQLQHADDPDRTPGLVFSYPVALTSTNGVTGSPSRATKADGESLFRLIGDTLAGLVEKAKTEVAPLGVERRSAENAEARRRGADAGRCSGELDPPSPRLRASAPSALPPS